MGLGYLPAGIKILWERADASRTLTLGFFFATGSRYDPPHLPGLAHMVEHFVFKGTRNHSASSLARLIDRVGGELNAWTDREEMAFICSVPSSAYQAAVEALVELCRFPLFPVNEWEREKEVVKAEIQASLEDPEELSYDDFLKLSCPGSWSHPIGGTLESLNRMRVEDARLWWERFFRPQDLVIVASGEFAPAHLVSCLTNSLADWPLGDENLPVSPAIEPHSFLLKQKQPFQMTQVLAAQWFPHPQTLRESLLWQMTSNLWGETMSSRLFQRLREERGLCYQVTSQISESYGPWSLQVFASCSPHNASAFLETLESEYRAWSTNPPSPENWDDARSALWGSVVLGAERTEARVGRLWRFYSSFGQAIGFEDLLSELEKPVNLSERDWIQQHWATAPRSTLLWGGLPRRWNGKVPWQG